MKIEKNNDAAINAKVFNQLVKRICESKGKVHESTITPLELKEMMKFSLYYPDINPFIVGEYIQLKDYSRNFDKPLLDTGLLYFSLEEILLHIIKEKNGLVSRKTIFSYGFYNNLLVDRFNVKGSVSSRLTLLSDNNVIVTVSCGVYALADMYCVQPEMKKKRKNKDKEEKVSKKIKIN